MMRNICLEGELGNRFGRKFSIQAESTSEIFKCINANRPEFRAFMIDCHEKGINVAVDTGTDFIEEDTLLEPLSKNESDITISLIPAGSKGIGKILAAIAIVAAIYFFPVLGTQAGSFLAAGATTVSATVLTAASFAMNLASVGFDEMMSPDPAVDQDAATNYLFNGDTQSIAEGDPVPVLYGELRVPGRPISIDISTTAFPRGMFYGYYSFPGGHIYYQNDERSST